ncbi:MAG TPA: hypothetical protein VEG30_01115 [Terriglobales bacterium]|nr:hypothetical protein [Terriglobales bacterium]
MSEAIALRPNMLPIASRVRAYFAPVDRTMETPVIFDPAKHGAFAVDSPPSPWVDLGLVTGVKRTAITEMHVLQSGTRGAACGQYRSKLGARLELEFCEWGKLQMALAGGSQHMNVLAADPNADAQPSGGSAIAPVAVLSGSTASEIVLGIGAVDAFSVGDIIAVDVDYQQQTGYVGTGVAAAYVSDPLDVLRDRDYVRRVTFNVGRVADKTTTSLILSQPLIGGTPPSAAAAQKISAFVDREGGSFFQEWSALLLVEAASGGRICFYYPRLQCAAPAAESGYALDPEFQGWALRASFLALPYIDRNDNQQVVCYRSYFPSAAAGLY